jgi:hypothetical protein
MSDFYSNEFIEKINLFCSKNNTTKPIFSYDLNRVHNNNIILLQKETGFTLSMKMELQDEVLLITNLVLMDNKQLEVKSAAIYDAATIEIMMQGLDILFHMGEDLDVDGVKLVLNKEEAACLSSFTCFFHLLPNQGHKVGMLLPLGQVAYDNFVHKTAHIHTKIQHALWQRQKEDQFLKDYLQNRQTDKLFLMNAPEPEDCSVFVGGNILAFPCKSSKEKHI